MVGGAQYVGIVLDDDDGVAQVAQLMKNMDQTAVSAACASQWKARPAHRAHPPAANPATWRAECAAPRRRRASRQVVERDVFEADRIQKTQRWRISSRIDPAISSCIGESLSASKNSLACAMVSAVTWQIFWPLMRTLRASPSAAVPGNRGTRRSRDIC